MPTPYAISSDLVSAWPAKSLEVATYLDTALAAKTDLAMTQNAQTGTSYSFVLLDASKLLTMSNAASNTVLVTKQATVTWVTGTQLRVVNLGAGVTTLVADSGVTINGNVALKQYQGGTLIRTASDVWLFVPTASSSGMDLITPISVAGSGVTLSGGQVTFTAATSVSINGCFTAAYENYRFYLTGTSGGNGGLQMRLRAAGVDASGADYRNLQVYVTDSAGPTRSYASASAFTLGTFGTNYGSASIDIFGPQTVSRTNVTGIAVVHDSTGVQRFDTSGSEYNSTTSFDGLTIYPSTSSITGTLRIYGLRNS